MLEMSFKLINLCEITESQAQSMQMLPMMPMVLPTSTNSKIRTFSPARKRPEARTYYTRVDAEMSRIVLSMVPSRWCHPVLVCSVSRWAVLLPLNMPVVYTRTRTQWHCAMTVETKSS